jgi:hypothetical protein
VADEKHASDSKIDDEDIKNLLDKGDDETLSRNNPLSEFLKQNKGVLKGLSQEEFKEKYDAFMKDYKGHIGEAAPKSEKKIDANNPNSAAKSEAEEVIDEDYLDRIVLKFTTLSETNSEAPSFTVTRAGAKIGRDPTNEVSVPSDTRLAHIGHSFIEHQGGSFYLLDGGYDFSASIRISVGTRKKEWRMMEKARFSVGNSVFESKGSNSEGNLVLEVIEGPLKGERRVVSKSGASLGRSSENVIAIPDRELSRKHSRVEYETTQQDFFVRDIGSTNGTYMQLVGPYGGRFKLSINDHILVGRTGFSINRYDYGISEEMGSRQTMEDSCTIIQHMELRQLSRCRMPQSFFGVFDGHGGANASLYLSHNLHVNVGEALIARANDIRDLLPDDIGVSVSPDSSAQKAIDEIVVHALETAFLRTDHEFITTSKFAQNGSTATTALVLGNRLYCANVGDSRSMICRYAPPHHHHHHLPPLSPLPLISFFCHNI